MITLTFVLLGLAGIGFVVRLLVGPSVADRLIATDGLVILVVCVLAVQTARTGDGFFIDAAVVIGLLGFVGTGVAARLVERQGG